MRAARAVLLPASLALLAHGARVTDEEEAEGLNLAAFPDVCDSAIVEETCKWTFGRETSEGEVGIDDVTEELSSCRPSMRDLWRHLGLSAQTDEKVTCTELCRKVTQSLAEDGQLPSKSYLGCLLGEGGALVCDMDLRPEALKAATQFEGDLPDFHDKDLYKVYNSSKPRMRCSDSVIDYQPKQAVRVLATRFRVYPPSAATISDEDFKGEGEALDVSGSALLQQTVAQDCSKCYRWASEPGGKGLAWYCKYMTTVCSGCSICESGGNSSSHGSYSHNEASPCLMKFKDAGSVYHNGRYVPGFKLVVECDRAAAQEPTLQIVGYEPLYFQTLNAGVLYTIFTNTYNEFGGKAFSLTFKAPCGYKLCRYSLDMQAPSGTWASNTNGHYPAPAPATPAPTPAPVYRPVRPHGGGGGGSGEESWKTDIKRVNVKAIAYIDTALQRFKRRETGTVMDLWYGPGSSSNNGMRKNLLKILNSVNDMLGNVEYSMGPECSPNTYAYVYPHGSTCSPGEIGRRRGCSKTTEGKFIFYICDLTLRSPLSVQIETLTHEGSHHATAFTDDVKFGQGTAYGRGTCQQLARTDSSEAMKNADNFCYYVQDVTDGTR